MENKVLSDKKGELRAKNYMVVGANCYAIDNIKGHEGFYKVIKDIPIAKKTEADILEIVKPYLIPKIKETVTQTNKTEDDSRSAKEYRAIIKLISGGLSKDNVFKEMELFSKWSTAPPQYREMTYNKAKAYVEKIKEEKEKVEKDLLEYKPLTEILKQPITKPRMRVEDFIPESGITYLASPPGEGKTMLAIYCSQCIASGRDFLGKKTIAGKVIYFDSENGMICLYDRFKRISEGHNFTDEELQNISISVYPYIRFDKDNKISFNLFNEFYNEFKPEVIIFDSLVRFMEGSENDAESCKKVFDFLRTWLKTKPNLTIIILHHLTKANQGGMNALRGSSELAASASSIILLKRLHQVYKLKLEKSRYIDMSKEHIIYYKLFDDEYHNLLFEQSNAKELPIDAVSRAKEDFEYWVEKNGIETFKSINCEDFLKTKGHSKNSVFELIKQLLNDKLITKLTRGNYEVSKEFLHTTEEENETPN